MPINDAAGDQTRYRAAVETAAAFSKSLAGEFDVRVRPFSSGVIDGKTELIDRIPSGVITDLGAGIADNLDPGRPQGQAMLLLSDGGHNAGAFDDVTDAVRTATALDTPIYTRTSVLERLALRPESRCRSALDPGTGIYRPTGAG